MNTFDSFVKALTSGNDALAEAAVQNLAENEPNPGEALMVIRELMENPAVDVRWWALRAASTLKHPETPALLLEGLLDDQVSVQQCAALGLRNHPTPEAIPHLMHLLGHADRLLSRLAGDALVAIGGDAVEPLMAILRDGPQANRVEAARALAHIRDPRAIPVFYYCLQTRASSMVEYWAEFGLDMLGVGMVFFKPGR